MPVKLKSEEELKAIRSACQVAAVVLEKLKRKIKAGVTTAELDQAGEAEIRALGAVPVFLGYRSYRYATCISVNEEIVHGIPGGRKLSEGDIVSVDIGARVKGYCGDVAATFAVGNVNKQAEKLLRVGKEALVSAIRQARAGKHLGDVSYAIQSLAEKNGYHVVRDLYGHGVGADLHEDPLIPNFGSPGEGPLLKPGMVLAIEPMINAGTWRIRTLEDGWTVVTEDGSLSCHFEHTVLVTEKDPEILTKL